MDTAIFQENIDITSLTTFDIPVKARWFVNYASVKDLQKILRTRQYQEGPVLHIGEGSNLLFISDYNGVILKSGIRGITLYRKDSSVAYIIAGAGESMDDVIKFSIDNGLSGLENLSGIPGQVGAAPVQNVGAYGVEAKDMIFKVEVYDTLTHKVITLSPDNCHFGYRDSIFKNEAKGRYFVLRVCFKLKISNEASELSYGPLRRLNDQLHRIPTPADVRNEIIKLRDAKLPNPKETGSAGSFFKNPVVSLPFFEQKILSEYPDAPHYKLENGMIKIPAGWLIEQCGLKGHKIGGAEVYPKQCLVIVNTGRATSADVIALAEKIQHEVNKKFGIRILPEVNYIDTHLHIEILGSGTSRGVPEPCCLCEVCTSGDSHDKRLRSSAIVRTQGVTILIDPSPDVREQLLRAKIYNIDAVLITHSHYDHVGGIDDLRAYCEHKPLPLYMTADVKDDLKRRIDYCFRTHLYPGVPHFEIHVINPENNFYIQGIKITPIQVMHAKLPIVGYRIQDFAYITDAKTIHSKERDKLNNLKALIVNSLRKREHFSHFNLKEALKLIDNVQPDRAYLTHLSHEIGLHKDLSKELPENIYPAFDGMKIEI